MKPCEHPAVWNSTELQSRADWQRRWTSEELTELDLLANSSTMIEQLDFSRPNPLPSEKWPHLAAKMLSVRDDLEHGCGATRIAGFPVERFGEAQSAEVFWRLMSSVGTPVPQTATGEQLFRVQDEGHAADHPKARGPNSSKRLSFHTDRCDVISFLCVRPAMEGGENQLVSSMAIYNHILAERPELLQQLIEPYTYQRHNVDPGNENAFYQQPVFSFCEGHFSANLLRVLIERAYASEAIGPMPEAKRQALDYLEEVAELPQMQVVFRQQPGDIVLLNNYVTLHRRNGFVDATDPSRKRLLFRVWLAVPNSRPLDASFAASYGETRAGQIRGGMRQMQP